MTVNAAKRNGEFTQNSWTLIGFNGDFMVIYGDLWWFIVIYGDFDGDFDGGLMVI